MSYLNFSRDLWAEIGDRDLPQNKVPVKGSGWVDGWMGGWWRSYVDLWSAYQCGDTLSFSNYRLLLTPF